MVHDGSIGLSFEDAIVIFELSYHNRELSFLLFWGKENYQNILFPIFQQENGSTLLHEYGRRTKVDKVLINPEDYLSSLRRTLSSISCIIEDIEDFSKKHNIDLLTADNIDWDTDSLTTDNANHYIFHYFSPESINSIYSFYSEDINLTNIDLSIKYAYSCLIQMKADLLVTISRFKKYVKDYPNKKLRNQLIENQYISTDYD
ncbi:MAG: hypothetical protein HFJ47_03265 [Clostridia bacterium]|nr:hypothetical protein [Clostridia bacterium]